MLSPVATGQVHRDAQKIWKRGGLSRWPLSNNAFVFSSCYRLNPSPRDRASCCFNAWSWLSSAWRVRCTMRAVVLICSACFTSSGRVSSSSANPRGSELPNRRVSASATSLASLSAARPSDDDLSSLMNLLRFSTGIFSTLTRISVLRGVRPGTSITSRCSRCHCSLSRSSPRRRSHASET